MTSCKLVDGYQYFLRNLLFHH